MDETSQTQECRRCHLTKPLSDFHVDRNRENGHRTICVECRSEKPKVITIAAEKTAEDLAREEATEQLIELHRTHFNHLLYSANVRRGLISPGQRTMDDPERRKFYAIDRIPAAAR